MAVVAFCPEDSALQSHPLCQADDLPVQDLNFGDGLFIHGELSKVSGKSAILVQLCFERL